MFFFKKTRAGPDELLNNLLHIKNRQRKATSKEKATRTFRTAVFSYQVPLCKRRSSRRYREVVSKRRLTSQASSYQ
ncbi:hypothetical protein J6590_105836, partial [Homalodisca vitripennis]